MYLRETVLVYNNAYSDVERETGLIIPKSLIKTELPPKTQLKISKHERKRIESLNDADKKLRKLKRVKTQREEWNAIEEKEEVVKPLKSKKPRAPKQAGKLLQKRLSKKKT